MLCLLFLVQQAAGLGSSLAGNCHPPHVSERAQKSEKASGGDFANKHV